MGRPCWFSEDFLNKVAYSSVCKSCYIVEIMSNLQTKVLTGWVSVTKAVTCLLMDSSCSVSNEIPSLSASSIASLEHWMAMSSRTVDRPLERFCQVLPFSLSPLMDIIRQSQKVLFQILLEVHCLGNLLSRHIASDQDCWSSQCQLEEFDSVTQNPGMVNSESFGEWSGVHVAEKTGKWMIGERSLTLSLPLPLLLYLYLYLSLLTHFKMALAVTLMYWSSSSSFSFLLSGAPSSLGKISTNAFLSHSLVSFEPSEHCSQKYIEVITWKLLEVFQVGFVLDFGTVIFHKSSVLRDCVVCQVILHGVHQTKDSADRKSVV